VIGTINELAGDPAMGEPHQVEISLVTERGGSIPYYLQMPYVASPPDVDYFPNFTNGQSAGVGVIESVDGQIYDTAWNQINGPGSAFYDADMRDIEESYTDAFIEIIAPPEGTGAVPYLAPEVLHMYEYNGDCNNLDELENDATRVMRFGLQWFANKFPWDNYFQVLGVSCPPVVSQCSAYEFTGDTITTGHTSLVSRCVIEANNPPSDEEAVTQDVTNHELAHQFFVNECEPEDSGHNSNAAWCGPCGGPLCQ